MIIVLHEGSIVEIEGKHYVVTRLKREWQGKKYYLPELK